VREEHEKQFNVYVEENDYYVRAYVSVYFKKVDAGFDHEFGFKQEWDWEPYRVIIESVRNPETGEEWRALPKELEKLIEEKALNEAKEKGL
jgi:hypothetical protein